MYIQQEPNPTSYDYSYQNREDGISGSDKQKLLAKLLASDASGGGDTQYVNGVAVNKGPYNGLGGLLGNLAQAYMMGSTGLGFGGGL